MIQMFRLGMTGTELQCCVGALKLLTGQDAFLFLIERKQNETMLSQRCVKDKCRNPDCSLISECAMGSLTLILVGVVWIHTRKEAAREIYTAGHAQTPCKAVWCYGLGIGVGEP